MSAVIFFVISAGIFLGSSVSKEYTCYQQLEGGTSRRSFSCQTSNALNQATTTPYSQTTPSSYPGCPRTLACTESSLTSVGTTTGSSTTTITSDTTWTPTNSITLTTASTAEMTGGTTGTTLSSPSTGSTISTTSITTPATVTSSSSGSSTAFSMTTSATTSNFYSTKLSTTPASLTTILTTEVLTTTESPTTTTSTTLATSEPTTEEPTTTRPTTTYPSTTAALSTSLLTSATSGANAAAPLVANDPIDQEASVYNCFSFDTFIASLDTEDIWCQEILEDHCRTNPCQNGATCINEPYRYRCVCAPGFTDPECMTQINLCENYPCEPFGTCEDFLNDYNCTCNSGFEFVNRTYCEDKDECQINTTATTTSTPTIPTEPPCSNGSECKNYPGGYECLCQKGKLGKKCKMDDKNELQTVTNIHPTFGLLAGGGLLNITGTNLSLYPHLGAYFRPENQSLQELYGFAEGNISDVIRIRIPRAPSRGYIGQSMSITIKYSNEKNLSVPQKYVYTDNPNITSISPDNILIVAGIKLRLKGQNMNSVNDPKLKVKIIMNDNETYINKTMKCFGISYSDMVCQLPLIHVYNATKNTTSPTRSKRNAIPDDAKFSQTKPKSDDSFNRKFSHWIYSWLDDESSGRSATWKSIRSKRDDGLEDYINISSLLIPDKIYLGLYFDNFPKYTNLTRSFPRYQPKLILSTPVFKFISKDSPQGFDPSLKESFKIEGEKMNEGLTLEDYTVGVGTGTCQPSHLEAKQLECLPPKFRPEPGPLADKLGCGENLPVTIGIGLLDPQFYACMQYVEAPLIIGLSVGLTGFLILVIIIAWLVCCLIRRKGRLQTDDEEAEESTTWNNELRPSYRRMVDDPDLEPEVRDFGGVYSTNVNSDRRVTQEQNPSDIVSVSQRNRGQAKDYFFYGENNPDVALVKKQTYGDFLKAKDRISYTRPNRQFDDVEDNKWEPKDYKQVYHNMSFNKQTSLDD